MSVSNSSFKVRTFFPRRPSSGMNETGASLDDIASPERYQFLSWAMYLYISLYIMLDHFGLFWTIVYGRGIKLAFFFCFFFLGGFGVGFLAFSLFFQQFSSIFQLFSLVFQCFSSIFHSSL